VGDYFGYSLKIDPSGSKDLIVSDYKGSGTGSVYFFISSSLQNHFEECLKLYAALYLYLFD
jgi:YHS domain-containing protein